MPNDTILKKPAIDIEISCPHCSHDHDCEHGHEHGHEHSHDGASGIRTTTDKIIFGIGIGAGAAAFLPGVPAGAELLLFLAAYVAIGKSVIITAVKNILKGDIFDENFLMFIASVGAFAIGEYPEAVAVMLFFQVGEYLQDKAVDQSKNSIKALLDLAPEYANLVTEDGEQTVTPDKVSIGETILIKPGEKIPLDGVIIEGSANIDTSSLTGESAPRFYTPGDEILSGALNLNSVIKIKTTKLYEQSTAYKIMELVEKSAAKKAPTERFITKFSKVYTPIVCAAAVLLAVVPPLLTNTPFSPWINRALVFLVVSCPCALVISVPLTFFSGIGSASRRGILMKGGNTLQSLAKIDTVVFDKTGTLTKGVFSVINIEPSAGYSERELLQYAYAVSKYSNHPVSKSVADYCERLAVRPPEASQCNEIGGQGMTGIVGGSKISAGNDKLMKAERVPFAASAIAGTKVYVGKDGKYVGCITIADTIKDDAAEAVSKLKRQGIGTIVMLTGDNAKTAGDAAAKIGITDVYANLLPQGKVDACEKLYAERAARTIAFLGDGINDAPVLARCDVGIAMGGVGSDASIETADVVIMNDEPSKVAEAISISRNTMNIAKQNIAGALAIKIGILMLAAAGLANMWMAVFADVGVTLLVVLNSMRKK